MSQNYDQHARERSSAPAQSGRRELPVWLQYVGVGLPLVVGLPAALLAIRTTTLDPLFWCLVLVVSVMVGLTSIKRSGPGQVALIAAAVGVAAAVGAAGPFGYQQGRNSSPAFPAPSPSALPGGPPSVEVGVRHEGPLVLPQPYAYVDLDAPADDPQWGALEGGNYPGADLQTHAGVVDTLSAVRARTVEGLTAPGLPDCRTITGYTGGSVSFKESQEGDVVCVLTDEGRFSRLRLVSYDPDTAVLTLMVTTWEKS